MWSVRFLVDGRFYNIPSIPSVMMCSDGSYNLAADTGKISITMGWIK